MQVLVTGAAGFIGYHVCRALLARGDAVLGVDNLNDYYDPALKQARLRELRSQPGFAFYEGDITSPILWAGMDDYQNVIHLAAQAGVRYSLDAPESYVASNVMGHLQVLEYCRRQHDFEHLVYASSSSVYGGNQKTPFAVGDPVEHPLSLYGATKRSGELMSESYSHLFRIPVTGLRFFTVYGPFGRPDMAYYQFTKALFAGEELTLFNNGNMARDFTYVDDIVQGVLSALGKPPEDDGKASPHRLFNLGHNQPENLARFVEVLEQATGCKAKIRHAPLQAGDPVSTAADIENSKKVLGFSPVTKLEDGLPRFVEWFRDYHQIS